jgi:hypothetical protein
VTTDDNSEQHGSDHGRACLDAARDASDRGELGPWVAEFLSSPGSDNAALAAQLQDPPRVWIGPMMVPMDRLHRLAGPPDQPALDRFDEDDLETVEGMQESIEDGWDPPPAIVSYRNEQLVVEDGNHRIEGLRAAGHERAWAVVGFETTEQLEQFRRELEALGPAAERDLAPGS